MYQIVHCDECSQPFNMALNSLLHYGIRKVCPTCEAAMVAAEQAQKNPALTQGQKNVWAGIQTVAAIAGILLLVQAIDGWLS